ncbi:MAG: hypothetical protein LBS21_02440 [Clostridiales bacterium]|jgi:hypothetical protein|nr:hypothetical protein [Clostridiales bacterium]
MSEAKENKPLGRPIKGKDRRMQIAIYVSVSALDTIDAYVEERHREKRSYSRSEFFNEAIEKHMKDLGLLDGEDGGANEK